MGLRITEVVGRHVLAGRVPGQTDYPKVEQAARAAASHDGRVLLDLAGIEVLSSSYFDAALWPLWSLTPELYPALGRVPQAAVDDIELILRANQAAVWSFKTESDRSPSLLGAIDPALKLTLDRVAEHGELTAGDLVEAKGSIGATGWSNRLASLHHLRLVRRRKDGRRLIYLLAWKE